MTQDDAKGGQGRTMAFASASFASATWDKVMIQRMLTTVNMIGRKTTTPERILEENRSDELVG